MIKLNDTYSIDGYSEKIKENLEEKLNGLGKTLLIEMMYLPEEDYELITPDTKISDIRDLKNAETQNAEEEQIEGQMDLLSDFGETVPDSEKPEENTLSAVIRELFRPREMKEYLDSLVNMDPDSSAMEWWVADFNQSGNRMFKKMPYFLFFYSKEEGVKVKNIKEGTIETNSYKDFYFMTRAAFGIETARGTDVWNQAFGAEYELEKQREQEAEEKKEQREKAAKRTQADPPEEKKPESLDVSQCEAASGTRNEGQKTTEMRTEEPEVVTGEVEKGELEEKNEVCDTAQTTDFLNKDGRTVRLPLAVGEGAYMIVPEKMDENGKVTHKYTLIKPYLYEVRGKNRIEMYYHKSDGKSGQINIKDLEKAMIYPDIDDPEQILKILEELDGKEE